MTSQHDLTNAPKWDIALEALAREEARLLGRDLSIDDFLRLAKEHAIRFDDIMVTMFELVLNNEWGYVDANDPAHEITRDEVNNLYVNGRLKDEDVKQFKGLWSPKLGE